MLSARIAFGQVLQRDRDSVLAAGGDDRVACGEVGDERAEGGGRAVRPGFGADAVGQRRAGQDLQEPRRARVTGRDGEGVEQLASRHTGAPAGWLGSGDIPAVVGVPQQRSGPGAGLDEGMASGGGLDIGDAPGPVAVVEDVSERRRIDAMRRDSSTP